VSDLSLWKYSFELVIKELDLTKRKKQALDELFETKKISESTFEYLEKDLNEAINDLETHLNSIIDKMTARSLELEKQIGTLELFLANLEIYHAAEEINNDTYENQNRAILLGLEATSQELNDIKDSLSKLAPKAIGTPTTPARLEEPPVCTSAVNEGLRQEDTTESQVTGSLEPKIPVLLAGSQESPT